MCVLRSVYNYRTQYSAEQFILQTIITAQMMSVGRGGLVTPTINQTEPQMTNNTQVSKCLKYKGCSINKFVNFQNMNNRDICSE